MKDKDALHLMIDLETAGLHPCAPILQIGAVTFDCHRPSIGLPYMFDGKASLRSNDLAGMHPELETLEWWEEQDSQLKARVFSGTDDIEVLLKKFCDFFDHLDAPANEVIVWAKPSKFDFPILEHAMMKCTVKVPWHYRNVRCLYTLSNLVGHLVTPEELAAVPPNTCAHDALADAMYQARLARLYLRKLI